MKKKTAKEVKMHKFLACACKSQDFAQIQKNFARSHDCMTVTFRNSDADQVEVCWHVKVKTVTDLLPAYKVLHGILFSSMA